MKTSMKFSSEFMTQYKRATIMDPQKKFEALQLHQGATEHSGASLLFSIGSDGKFYLTREQPGSKTGWEKLDLSSSVAEADFGSEASSVECVTFEAAQGTSGEVDLATIETGSRWFEEDCRAGNL